MIISFIPLVKNFSKDKSNYVESNFMYISVTYLSYIDEFLNYLIKGII
ncbi:MULTISPECIES: hypothetical protein [Sulfolobaceae]|nr:MULTISPECIES: hypothetical protein [unclassified Sulfolobus]